MLRSRRLVLVTVAAALALVTGVIALAPAGAQTATCFGRSATIIARPGVVTLGTPGNDVIIGTPGDDVIRGRGGNDLICAGGGNDRVLGGRGADHVDLGAGHDFTRGGPGPDLLAGGEGNDIIRGRAGHDIIQGDAGMDTCRGGRGRDSLQSCNETPPSTISALTAPEQEMVTLVQELRSRYGVGPLNVSIELSDVARGWSVQLPAGFQHNPSVGSQIPDGWTMWGENIAYNGSVRAAFDALVNSPSHFDNMIDPDFTHIGVGVQVEGGRVYVTQVFARY